MCADRPKSASKLSEHLGTDAWCDPGQIGLCLSKRGKAIRERRWRWIVLTECALSALRHHVGLLRVAWAMCNA
jgi:hypothetical protein